MFHSIPKPVFIVGWVAVALLSEYLIIRSLFSLHRYRRNKRLEMDKALWDAEKFAGGNSIWTLTGIPYQSAPTKNPHCFGFYHRFDIATKAVEDDIGSLHECYHEYLAVEEFQPGIIATSTAELWHCRIENKWVPCEKPARFQGTTGFGMG